VFKYKEAFSAELVEKLLHDRGIHDGHILDPFAGSGTALFAANTLGLDTTGIEVLPIGIEIMRARQVLEHNFTIDDFAVLDRWRSDQHSSRFCQLTQACGNLPIPLEATASNLKASRL
jgi:DNA methylase